MRHYYIKDSQQSTKNLVSSINLEHKNNFDYLFVVQIALLQFKNQENYFYLLISPLNPKEHRECCSGV